jgi:hypothetical protein
VTVNLYRVPFVSYEKQWRIEQMELRRAWKLPEPDPEAKARAVAFLSRMIRSRSS